MDNEKTYAVYMHISPSNKRYIGITSMKPVEKRWANGCGYSSQYFSRAIEKYGWENFQHIIIATDLSEKDAIEMEIDLIKKYKSNQRDFGYNITAGGEGTNGMPRSQNAIELQRIALSKPVYQFDLEYNFIAEHDGVRAAARHIQCKNKSGIQKCCNYQGVTAYGYIWRYKKDVPDPFDKSTIPKFESKYNTRPIYQINRITREYCIWDCIKDAVNATGYSVDLIRQSCDCLESVSYSDYKWVYCDQIDNIDLFVSDDNNFIRHGVANAVKQLDLSRKLVSFYCSISEAANKLNLNRKRIVRACNNNEEYGNSYWEYAT